MSRINFVGDIGIFKRYESENIDPFDRVQLPAADYNVGNLEFPLPRPGVAKKFYDVSDAYRVSYDFAGALKMNRFQALSLANNHVVDYGEQGLRDTIELLEARSVSYFGAGSDGPFHVHRLSLGGLSFALIGVVKAGRWDRNNGALGPDPYRMELLSRQVRELQPQVDHVIVFPHWGTELVDAPPPPDVANARALVEAGARCVIGHHPHVIQGIERYRNGLIAYSLGSFIYLSEEEQGNVDRSPARDLTMCLAVAFDKNSVTEYAPHKYVRKSGDWVPEPEGTWTEDTHFTRLCSVIGDSGYYASQVRKNLVKREIASFWVRFKRSPGRALGHYLGYMRWHHLKKLLG